MGTAMEQTEQTALDTETVTVGGREWMKGYLSVDDGGEGIYHNERTGLVYYTKRAALRVARGLRGWRIPESDDFRVLNDGGLLKIGLRDSGSADIVDGSLQWFGKETPYLMGLTEVMFRNFGDRIATFNVKSNDIAPVKLIREEVPVQTYSTPLVSGMIEDYGNFAGAWWSEKSYKYNEMHGRVERIIKDALEKAKRDYPDCVCAMYVRISEPWARQSCMMVKYRLPMEAYRSLRKALEPTAVCLDDYVEPWEVGDDIYDGRKSGYISRVPG